MIYLSNWDIIQCKNSSFYSVVDCSNFSESPRCKCYDNSVSYWIRNC